MKKPTNSITVAENSDDEDSGSDDGSDEDHGVQTGKNKQSLDIMGDTIPKKNK